MYDLETIVQRNREAERLGIITPGSAVGTTGFVPLNERSRTGATRCFGEAFQPRGHTSEGDGIPPHSLGEDYPFAVVGGFRPLTDAAAASGSFNGYEGSVTTWTVTHYETGETFKTYDGLPVDPKGCENAHIRAHDLKCRSAS